MKQKTFIIKKRLGFPAREAAIFVDISRTSKSEVWVEKNGERADGKSVVGLLTLAISYGSSITITVEGEDEDAVMEKISDLME